MTDVRRKPIIRVFISSTFDDLRAERNFLQETVFPELERFCLNHGFQFQAIDLRWGVSTEAGQHHRTMLICLDELARSQDVSPRPNFLILLGNRYGWRPLPEAISASEFRRLTVEADALDKRLGEANRRPSSGKDGVLDKLARLLRETLQGKTFRDVLEDWYRRDENALVLEHHQGDPDRETLDHVLQSRLGRRSDELDYWLPDVTNGAPTAWMAAQEVLWAVINGVFARDLARKGLDRFENRFEGINWSQHQTEVHSQTNPKRAIPQVVRFQGSATEQEIWAGAFAAEEAEKHVLAFFREFAPPKFPKEDATLLNRFFDDPLTAWSAKGFRELPALSALKETLRDRLKSNAITLETPAEIEIRTTGRGERIVDVSDGHLAQLGKVATSRLMSIIRDEIRRYRYPKLSGLGDDERIAAMPPERSHAIERGEHRQFAEELARDFEGRQTLRSEIAAYLADDVRTPLVVVGPSGSGKSAVMARAFLDCSPEDRPGEPFPLIRFLGTTPQSSDLRRLVTNLCQELRRLFPLSEPVSSELTVLVEEFRTQLSNATIERTVILFLDALDQLADADNALRLFWLPLADLPPHVKLVVSCLSDRSDAAGAPFAVLKSHYCPDATRPKGNWKLLGPLLPAEIRRLFFDTWIRNAGRQFSKESDQRRRIESHLRLNEGSEDEPAPHQTLYLKLLFEEVRYWRSYDDSHLLPEQQPGQTHFDALLQQFFARLQEEAHHGDLLVRRVLGYLAAARRGLTETELLEILHRDPEYRNHLERLRERTGHPVPEDPPRIPVAIWARLRFDLAPYLVERSAPGGIVLAFYHRQVAEWVEAAFLKRAEWHVPSDPRQPALPPSDAHPHTRLAAYFRKPRRDKEPSYFLETLEEQRARARRIPPTPRPVHVRMVDELPFQLLEVAKLFGGDDANSPHWNYVADLFTDIDFLEARTEAAE